MFTAIITGASKLASSDTIKFNQTFNASCFSFDDSCDSTKKLWCIDNRCQCYDQLAYWRAASNSCTYCAATFYYDGTACTCPQLTYLHTPSTTCREFSSFMKQIDFSAITFACIGSYGNISQSCASGLLCDETRGLQCISSTCQCPSGYYWNSTASDTKAVCGINISISI